MNRIHISQKILLPNFKQKWSKAFLPERVSWRHFSALLIWFSFVMDVLFFYHFFWLVSSTNLLTAESFYLFSFFLLFFLSAFLLLGYLSRSCASRVESGPNVHRTEGHGSTTLLYSNQIMIECHILIQTFFRLNWLRPAVLHARWWETVMIVTKSSLYVNSG